jgi:hypothetical protein
MKNGVLMSASATSTLPVSSSSASAWSVRVSVNGCAPAELTVICR